MLRKRDIYIPYDVTPVDFWGYTSCVMNRILEVSYTHGDEISDFRDYLLAKFQDAGIPAHMDNKIVFECVRDGRKFYIGFYDNSMSLGFDICSDSYNYEAKRKAWAPVRSNCVDRTCTNNRWER